MLGNGRLQARCEDTTVRLCKIRGSMRRSEWISVGDVILIALREFQETKADVLHKYQGDDVRLLRRLGELGRLFVEHDTQKEDDEEDLVVFDGEDMSFVDAL